MRKETRILALMALGLSSHAQATALFTPVTFAASTDKREQVKTECKIGELLETRVGKALSGASKGEPGTTTSTDGAVIKLDVRTIWGARGNNWTGPKGLIIHVDLLNDGVLQRSAELHRTTMGGIAGPFMGICGFMERDIDALAKDVARWSGDEHFVGDTSAVPVEQVPASAPAN